MTDNDITFSNIPPSHIIVGNVKVDLRTGEVYIPEDMDISEASLMFWKALGIHAKNSFDS